MLSNQEPPAAASRPGHEPQCTVCMHPQRSEVDLFLLRASVRRTAARYGLSKSAVQRHREAHIPELLAAGEQILEEELLHFGNARGDIHDDLVMALSLAAWHTRPRAKVGLRNDGPLL